MSPPPRIPQAASIARTDLAHRSATSEPLVPRTDRSSSPSPIRQANGRHHRAQPRIAPMAWKAPTRLGSRRIAIRTQLRHYRSWTSHSFPSRSPEAMETMEHVISKSMFPCCSGHVYATEVTELRQSRTVVRSSFTASVTHTTVTEPWSFRSVPTSSSQRQRLRSSYRGECSGARRNAMLVKDESMQAAAPFETIWDHEPTTNRGRRLRGHALL